MHSGALISVVIPTLDAADVLPATLAALAPGAVEGLVREVIVSDGGSTDETVSVAEAAGATIAYSERGRGTQLARGAQSARGRWLLVLHADTVLDDGWRAEARSFIAGDDGRAAVFTLRFADVGIAPRIVAVGAMIRTRLLAAPYGDQGLLIRRDLYDEVGGYRPLPLFEDVDLIDRIVAARGRKTLTVLKSKAVTSAARYQGGYLRRVFKNARCLAMYRAGTAPEKIAKYYR